MIDQFVTLIQRKMDEDGLTVREVADRAGVGYPYLYRVLKGDQSPTLQFVEKIIEALGISVKITS